MIDDIIDVSHWNEPVDFRKVAGAGIVAVIAKASQGAGYTDPAYASFRKQAAAQGLLWGSYHFGTGDDAAAQVEHYLGTASPGDGDLVCLDFEPDPHGASMTLGQARDFVGLFQQRTGRYPVLYGGYWLKQQLGHHADALLARCPLWLAQYAPAAVLPPGWKAYALWQFTDREQALPGVRKVDRDRFDGSDVALRRRWPFG
jgi:lysozyme